MGSLRVQIIDPYYIVREGLRLLVGQWPNCSVVGGSGSDAAALVLAARELPDLILLEPEPNPEHGLALLAALRSAVPASHILILTFSPDPKLHLRCLGAGAMGVVHKSRGVEVLQKALKRVAAGHLWLDAAGPEVTPNVAANEAAEYNLKLDTQQKEPVPLTAREREMIGLLCQGLKTPEIAARLFISEKTVRNLMTVLFTKLQVGSRLELVFYGIRQGLANPND